MEEIIENKEHKKSYVENLKVEKSRNDNGIKDERIL